MAKLLGRAWVRYNGKLLRSNEGAKIDLGGTARETVTGAAEVHGHFAKTMPGRVECEIPLAKGDSPEELRDIEDATITFECDTGQTYIIRNAASLTPPVITAGGGGAIPVVFEGQPAERA